METNKRGRGRPKGTGRPDQPILNAVADMLFEDPKLRPTTAMRRAAPNASEADIRRLQVKWKAGAADLMASAEARHSARAVAKSTGAGRATAGRAAAASLSELGRMATDIRNDSATMRAARELQDSPAMRAIRELEGDATMKAIREFERGAAGRAIREFYNDRTLRAVREQQEMVERLRRDGWLS